MKYRRPVLAGVILFLIVLPDFLGPYYKGLLTEVFIFGLYCLGFDIIFGFTGLLNFGMSVFFGLGGYLVLWSVVYLHAGLWTALAVTIIGSAIFSFIYGAMVSRFKSHYFVAITLVISMIFFYLAMAERPITGADEGLTLNVPNLNLGFVKLDFYNALVKYYFVVALSGLVFFLIWRFFHTPYGKAITAVRENEMRAKMIGYNTTALKIVSFTLSGIVGSLGGALYVLHMGFDSAHSFFWIWTARAVWWTIIGGAGTLLGSFVGPGILVFFEDFISTWSPDLYLIIMGIIMILVIMLASQGVVGSIQNAFAKRGKNSAGST